VRQWQHWGSGCYAYRCHDGRIHIQASAHYGAMRIRIRNWFETSCWIRILFRLWLLCALVFVFLEVVVDTVGIVPVPLPSWLLCGCGCLYHVVFLHVLVGLVPNIFLFFSVLSIRIRIRSGPERFGQVESGLGKIPAPSETGSYPFKTKICSGSGSV
jgi:hypothetical protein